ncbi:MAG: ABC transporter permease [Acidimicrobiia bacterium]
MATLAASPRESWIYWEWVGDHLAEIRASLVEHVILTVLTVVIGLAISIPLAVLVRRWRPAYAPVLWTTGAMYSIPSLALFGILIPITGLSRTTALIPLVAYTLLILVRNIVTGLNAVPEEVRDAARGMGYTGAVEFVRVDVPLALPAIFAGIRIATVSTIALITVTAVIGQDSLGRLILDGLQRDFRTPLVVGLLLTVLLAIAAELFLLGLQWLLTPWMHRKARTA